MNADLLRSRYRCGAERGRRECTGALPFRFPKMLDVGASEEDLAYARGYLDGYMRAAEQAS